MSNEQKSIDESELMKIVEKFLASPEYVEALKVSTQSALLVRNGEFGENVFAFPLVSACVAKSALITVGDLLLLRCNLDVGEIDEEILKLLNEEANMFGKTYGLSGLSLEIYLFELAYRLLLDRMALWQYLKEHPDEKIVPKV